MADLLLVRDDGQTAAEALRNLRPEAVFGNGKLKLLSETAAERFRAREIAAYEKVEVEGRGRFRLPFEISKLISMTEADLGTRLTLAGKVVSV